jgi:hypothetical protein
MGLRHVAVATTWLVLGACLSATPASAHPPYDRPDPVPVPRDGHHGPSTVTTNVPPGGTSMITTPTLAADDTEVKVVVKAKPKSPAEEEDFDQFFTSINTMPKSKRLLACTMMYQLLLNPEPYSGAPREFSATNLVFAGAVLQACLEMAGLIQTGAPVGRTAPRAGSKCGLSTPAMPMTVTHDSAGYHISANGTPTKFKKTKLKVKCKQTGSTLTITVRSRKKGQPLRKAAGPKLMIGLKSPPTATTTVPVQVTVSSR